MGYARGDLVQGEPGGEVGGSAYLDLCRSTGLAFLVLFTSSEAAGAEIAAAISAGSADSSLSRVSKAWTSESGTPPADSKLESSSDS